jgi:hypothetical protein
VIAEEDQYNNLVTSDNTTVVTAYLGSGPGTLQGTVTATLAGGVATFNGLDATTAGTITLQFTGGGLYSDASDPIVISPAAASKLVVQTQPSATATAGEAFGDQPVIYEEDQYNNLETGDDTTSVTVSLGSGVGPLQGTASVAVQGGVATFAGLADNTAETITLNYSAGSFTAGPSTVVVNPAVASKLVIQTQPSASATAGQAFTTQPVLYLEDQYNNLETGDNTTSVTVSVSSGDEPLQGTTSVTAVGGVATFAGLADTTAETITLNYSAGNFTAGPSTVVINPAAAAKLVIQTQPSATATAGQAFAIQPVIFEEDQYNNLETGDNNTYVTAAAFNQPGPIHGDVSMFVAGGIATFTNLMDYRAETLTLKFTGGGLTVEPSAPIVVSPTVEAYLQLRAQVSSTSTAGQPFASQPALELIDQFGNVESSDNSTPVSVTLGSGVGPLLGTTTVMVSAGVATFVGLSDNVAGPITLNYSGGGFTASSSLTVTVNPAAASKLVIQTQPSATATAGLAFATQPVILEEDQYGNLETGDNSTLITAVVNNGTGPIHGATATIEAGVATFINLEDDKAEALSLKFTGAGLSSLPANSIVVHAAAATKLVVVTNQSGQVPAGSGFQIIVEAQDQFGNVDPLFNGKMSLALAYNPNGETLGGTLSSTAIAGVATFTGLTLDKPSGVYTLSLSGGGLESQSPKTPVAPPTPAQIPTVTGASVVMPRKTNKKGKPQGKAKFSGFNIQYSIAMGPTSAGLTTNYVMEATTTKRVKKRTVKILTPVKFIAKYDPTSESVTLTVTGKNPFAKGGQITILTAPPTGVSSELGVPLNSSYAFFNISANAKQIKQGVPAT